MENWRDHDDIPVQAGKVTFGRIFVTEGEVAQVIHCIAFGDSRIPISDKCLVHLIHIFIGTVAVLDDIKITKMLVSREVNCHPAPLSQT